MAGSSESATAHAPRQTWSGDLKLAHPGYVVEWCPNCDYPEADGGWCPNCGWHRPIHAHPPGTLGGNAWD